MTFTSKIFGLRVTLDGCCVSTRCEVCGANVGSRPHDLAYANQVLRDGRFEIVVTCTSHYCRGRVALEARST